MKLLSLFIIVGCLQVSARSFSQQVTLTAQNSSLKSVFREIEKQTGFLFLYDKQLLSSSKPVTISLSNMPLNEALRVCLKDQKLAFNIEEKTIVITSAPAPQRDNLEGFLPPGPIRGRVTDETGSPLAGATVTVKGSKNSGVTNAEGVFRINASAGDVLIISFVGYDSQSVDVTPAVVASSDQQSSGVTKGNSSFTITLKAAENNLQEVIINKGYYDEKKELSTGDATVITTKQIEQQPVSNILSVLEGQVPGLQVTQTSGLPGGSYKVQIRGQNSISSGTDPFYVIDGVPYISQMPSASGSGLINGSLNGGNPLNFIDPSDIESVTVLKDADATSIYGSRAANGAILISTKKGKAGKMKVDLSYYTGVTSPDRTIQLMNTQQYLKMRHEAFANDGTSPNPNSDFDLTFWDTTRNTNWEKVLLNSHPVTSNAQATVSGGTTNTQYLIGAGYSNQTSGMPVVNSTDGQDHSGSVHFNINTQSDNQRFKIQLTGSFLSNKNTIQPIDLAGQSSLLLPPDAPAIFNPNGTLNWAPITPGQIGTWTNPYSNLYNQYKGTTTNLVSNAILSYGILSNLVISANIGYTNLQTNEVGTFPTTAYDPGYELTSGSGAYSSFNNHTWIVEPKISYNTKIGKGNLDALLGGSLNENDQSGQVFNGTGYISDALIQDIQAASILYPQSGSSEYKYEAIYARLNYNWDDKYILNLTARRDGSSRFGPGKQFGDFGSAGLAWIFSKEKWVTDNLPWLSFGKLRASYGTTGNDQIGDYQYISLYQVSGSSSYQNSQTLYPANLSNPELSWEVDKKLDAGIELGFLKGRINLEVSYYRNRSNNQLVSTSLSLVTGFGSIPSNLPANVQNAGEELVLNTTNIKSKDFTWSSSFNISSNHNKLLSYPGLGTLYGNFHNYAVGQPLSSVLLFHMIGVNPATGLYQFASTNAQTTSSPTPADQTERLDLAPKFLGGFTNTFTYKNLSLNILFQFAKQTGVNYFGRLNNQPGIMNGGNLPIAFLNSWQKPGDQAKFEQFTQSYGDAYRGFLYAERSDFAYSDASFIRLKNLSLSWGLPQNWMRQANLASASLFIQGENLLTITNYFGIDPETQTIGSPPKQIWTAGIRVGF